jgi:hypothetical protein
LAVKKEFFDKLETRSPKAREAALMAALPRHIAWAKKRAPGFAKIFSSINASKIASRKALAALPLTRKSDLAALQKALPPLGGLNATAPAKLFVSPGPINDPEGTGANWWRTARGLHAGGFREGDVILNSYAYHFTPAGSMLESGAIALGCTVVPAGTGQTEMQVAAIERMRISGYVGTPSFLKLIVEKAHELKSDISSLKKAQVGAEYLPPVLRTALQEVGISVTQMYGSADLGLVAYESLLPGGRFALDYLNVPGVLRGFQPHVVTKRATSAGEVVLWRDSAVDLALGAMKKRWTYFMPSGERVEHESTVKLYLPDAVAKLLGRVGFVDVTFFGDVRGGALSFDSPRCITVARRPA